MKTVKTVLGKVMIVTVTMFLLGLAVAGSGSANASVVKEDATALCGVSDADVVKYLTEHGYVVETLRMVEGCCDRVAYTQNPYETMVYVMDSRIVGHEDIEVN